MQMWIIDVFRGIISMIDGIVYWFIDLLISLFDNLSSIKILDDSIVSGIANRLYFLISIIMIFKVSFSIIQYIINPDIFSDRERGMGKVIQGIVIMLVALVGVKYVFNLGYKLQDSIIHSHIIEKVILGVDSNLKTAEQQKDRKSSIPIKLLNAFISPNTSQIPLFSYDYDNNTYTCGKEPMYKDVNKNGFVEYNPKFGECFPSDTPYNYVITASDEKEYHVNGHTGVAYNISQESKDYRGLLQLINDKYKSDKSIYIFDYKFLLSTAIGIFVAIIYINFCFDLAIRTVKFGFLQLIAPIPIISMIDPKSAKGGMMSKYVKMCINTYLGLFIRIAGVNFVVFIVDIVFSNTTWGTVMGKDVGIFIQIIILIGALMFAKELPKLISDLTGIDLSGNFKLNPFKRLSEMPGAGAVKALGAGALGAVGGLAANAYALRNKQWSEQWWKNPFMAVGSLLGGGFSGAFRGLRSNDKNMFKAAGAGIHGSVEARNLRARRIANGDGGPSGWVRRRGADIDNWAGIESGATKFDNEIAAYDEIENQANELLKIAEKEMVKANGLSFVDASGTSITMSDYKARQEELKLLQGMDTSHMSEAQIKAHARKISDLSDYITKTGKEAAKAWIDGAQSGAISDSAALTAKNKLQALQDKIARSAYSNISSQAASTGKEVKDLKDEMERIKSEVMSSDAYRQAQVNRRNDSNSGH